MLWNLVNFGLSIQRESKGKVKSVYDILQESHYRKMSSMLLFRIYFKRKTRREIH